MSFRNQQRTNENKKQTNCEVFHLEYNLQKKSNVRHLLSLIFLRIEDVPVIHDYLIYIYVESSTHFCQQVFIWKNNSTLSFVVQIDSIQTI